MLRRYWSWWNLMASMCVCIIVVQDHGGHGCMFTLVSTFSLQMTWKKRDYKSWCTHFVSYIFILVWSPFLHFVWEFLASLLSVQDSIMMDSSSHFPASMCIRECKYEKTSDVYSLLIKTITRKNTSVPVGPLVHPSGSKWNYSEISPTN
jgi:hypothetical protein